jgi:DNA repair protein RadA
MKAFKDIRGIGPKGEEKLRARGIDSVEKLASLRMEQVIDILGVSRIKADEILRGAKELALERLIELQTAEDIFRYRREVVQRISTGSAALDALLGGGIETDNITALAGAFATGKSQLCHQVAVNCLVDLKRKAAYLETEPNTFSPQRILQMAKGRGLEDIDLRDIFVVSSRTITDPFRQKLAYERVERAIRGGMDIGLLVVDSFTARFRAYYHGREMFPVRAEELANHIGILEELASKYNLAILLTTQVGGLPDEGLQLEALKRFGIRQRPYGGEYLQHSAGTWLSLRQYKKDVWEAELFDSSSLPRGTAYFRLTSEGVRDVPPSPR